MALDHAAATHELPCGRHVEDVLDEVDTGALSDHTLACPHCTTARHGIQALSDATRAILEDPAEPRPGLGDRIMAAIRTEVRAGDSLPLPTAHGNADISLRALATLLRFAADTVPGIRARHCRITPDPTSNGARPERVTVDMTLTVRYGTPLETLLNQARTQITIAMSGRIGLPAHTVNLEVVDLWDETR